MPTPPKKTELPSRHDQELLRLTFCGIVVATFFAALVANHDLRNLLSPGGSNIATTVLGLSAALAFVYLLSVAAALKYQAPSRIDRFPIHARTAQFFYDASINVYGVYLLVLAVQWIDHHYLHLPQTVFILPVYIVIFSVSYFVARVAWALVQAGIEYYYEFQNRRP
jgi:hypothetical protein